MGLEKRGGGTYYYESRRAGEKVRKHYVGAGEFARMMAEGNELLRTMRRHEQEQERAEQENIAAMIGSVMETLEPVDTLAEAALVANGYHRRRGEWRRRRAGHDGILS